VLQGAQQQQQENRGMADCQQQERQQQERQQEQERHKPVVLQKDCWDQQVMQPQQHWQQHYH
jgi:hypothetical protein